jgi:hypothetical protein
MHPLQAARLSAPDMIIQVDIRISDLVRKNENIDLISDMNRTAIALGGHGASHGFVVVYGV